MQNRRKKLLRSKTKNQQDMDKMLSDVQVKRSTYTQAMRDIEMKATLRMQQEFKIPICPKCGNSTRNNKMNGVPWCFTCNSPVDKKTTGSSVKALSKDEAMRRQLKELHPGFYP